MIDVDLERRAISPTDYVEFPATPPSYFSIATVPKAVIDQALGMMDKTRLYELQPDELPVITSIVSDLLRFNAGEFHTTPDAGSSVGTFEQVQTTRTWTPEHDLLLEHIEFRRQLSTNGKKGSLRRNEVIPNRAIQPNGTVDIREVRLKEKTASGWRRTASFLASMAIGMVRFSDRTTKRYGNTVYQGYVETPERTDEGTLQREDIEEGVYEVSITAAGTGDMTQKVTLDDLRVLEGIYTIDGEEAPITNSAAQHKHEDARQPWGIFNFRGTAAQLRAILRGRPKNSSADAPFQSGKGSSANKPFEAFN